MATMYVTMIAHMVSANLQTNKQMRKMHPAGKNHFHAIFSTRVPMLKIEPYLKRLTQTEKKLSKTL